MGRRIEATTAAAPPSCVFCRPRGKPVGQNSRSTRGSALFSSAIRISRFQDRAVAFGTTTRSTAAARAAPSGRAVGGDSCDGRDARWAWRAAPRRRSGESREEEAAVVWRPASSSCTPWNRRWTCCARVAAKVEAGPRGGEALAGKASYRPSR